MLITQSNPSPGVEAARLEFPFEGYLGTGVYQFEVKGNVLSEPRLTTTSCYKVPLFAIRADLNSKTGELWVGVGRADDSAPETVGFLLPRFIKDVPDHNVEVQFQNWQIIEARMDGAVLGHAPIPTEVILIFHGVEQIVSACDLLRPNGSVALEVSGNLEALDGAPLFLLQSHDYRFQLLVDDGELVLQRSGYEIRARPDTDSKSIIWVVWSQTQLQLMLPFNRDQTIWTVRTPIAVPPKSLLQLARVKKLQPTTSFESVEAFRTAVHEAFCSLQDDLAETGAYNGFWNQHYEGRRKSTPVPKRETDIHRQLLLQLIDWAKMRSVEIVPENETAVGKLDICFIGHVVGQGPVSFCVEVKLAHAQDLLHGLETQLPEYMAVKRAKYGAYVVLWFKGDWFDLPSRQTIHNLRQQILPGDYEPPTPELAELGSVLTTKAAITLELTNIRVFVLDMTKPTSASKK